ncbi:hypothetical protein ACIPWL_18535 [Streptomyces sp. NPDC090023]|uniref:hypothetical protein n=1 Tax=unclassified Streptomyces TaxID=2593676 RepID=UPI0038245B05
MAALALLITLATTLGAVLMYGNASGDSIAQTVATVVAGVSGIVTVVRDLVSRRRGENDRDHR